MAAKRGWTKGGPTGRACRGRGPLSREGRGAPIGSAVPKYSARRLGVKDDGWRCSVVPPGRGVVPQFPHRDSPVERRTGLSGARLLSNPAPHPILARCSAARVSPACCCPPPPPPLPATP